MNTTFRSLCAGLLTLAISLSGCSRQDEQSELSHRGSFTFRVAADTRATIENGAVAWQIGDMMDLCAVESGSHAPSAAAAAFSYAGDDTFSGDLDLAGTGTYDFYALYPANGGGVIFPEADGAKTSFGGTVRVGAEHLTQNGGTADHVMQFSPMYGTAGLQSAEGLTMAMHHYAALLDFTVVNNHDAAVTVRSLSMSVPGSKGFCGTYRAFADGTLAPASDTSAYSTCTVTVEGAPSLEKGGSMHIYIPVAPFTIKAGSQVNISIVADAGACEMTRTLSADAAFAAGTASTQTLSYSNPRPAGRDLFFTPGGAGTKDGSTWQNAADSAALKGIFADNTCSGCRLHLAEGTYGMWGAASQNSSYCRLEVLGGYPAGLAGSDTTGRDASLHSTVLDGRSKDVILSAADNTRWTFDGVTFANGRNASKYGGAIIVTSASADVTCTNCTFSGNYANQGGAVFVHSGLFRASGCTFSGNSASSRGGALRADSADGAILLDKCTFHDNSISDSWGTVAHLNNSSSMIVNNCSFHDNGKAGKASSDPVINGQVNLLIANSSVIGSNNNSLVRVEGPCIGYIINSLILNTAGKDAICVNNSNYNLVSKGHNLLGNAGGNARDNFMPAPSDLRFADCSSLNISWDGGLDNYIWDDDRTDLVPAGIEDLRYALESFAFKAGDVGSIGACFLEWLGTAALATDRNGNARQQNGMRPGSYEATHLSRTATPECKVSNTSPMLREKVIVRCTNMPVAGPITIDWGDGSRETFQYEERGGMTHKYGAPGSCTMSVTCNGTTTEYAVTIYPLLALSEALEEFKDPACKKIWVMAHRAHTTDKTIPENSVKAVQAAIAEGAEVIETDTRLTKDGQIVICHDATINATTNGTGTILDMTLDQIKSYRLKDRSGKVTTEVMPTLEEFLLACRGKVYVNLDYSPRTASTAQVMDVVEKLGMQQQVFMYCNSAAKVAEVFAYDIEAHPYVTYTAYQALLSGPYTYMTQIGWKTSLKSATHESIAAGCIETVNMLHVNDSNIPEYSIYNSYLDALLNMFPNCHVIQNDCPKELNEALAKKGRK